MNITDADRKAAAPFIEIGKSWTGEKLAQAFAAHRLRGIKAGLKLTAVLFERIAESWSVTDAPITRMAFEVAVEVIRSIDPETVEPTDETSSVCEHQTKPGPCSICGDKG